MRNELTTFNLDMVTLDLCLEDRNITAFRVLFKNPLFRKINLMLQDKSEQSKMAKYQWRREVIGDFEYSLNFKNKLISY